MAGVIRCPVQRSTEWLTCYGYCHVCEKNKVERTRPRSRYCKTCLDDHAAGRPPKWSSHVLDRMKNAGPVLKIRPTVKQAEINDVSVEVDGVEEESSK